MRAPGQRVGGIGGHAGGESTGSDQGGAIVEGNTPRRRARKAQTVAVKVTVVPMTAGFGEALSTVVVRPAVTLTTRGLDIPP